MMLLILTSVLGYELKTAVGTSVFIMSFLLPLQEPFLIFTIGGMPDFYSMDSLHCVHCCGQNCNCI